MPVCTQAEAERNAKNLTSIKNMIFSTCNPEKKPMMEWKQLQMVKERRLVELEQRAKALEGQGEVRTKCGARRPGCTAAGRAWPASPAGGAGCLHPRAHARARSALQGDAGAAAEQTSALAARVATLEAEVAMKQEALVISRAETKAARDRALEIGERHAVCLLGRRGRQYRCKDPLCANGWVRAGAGCRCVLALHSR
jgi:hypothetical protein